VDRKNKQGVSLWINTGKASGEEIRKKLGKNQKGIRI